jgi:hypothetical protein
VLKVNIQLLVTEKLKLTGFNKKQRGIEKIKKEGEKGGGY